MGLEWTRIRSVANPDPGSGVFFASGYGIRIRISRFAMRYLLDPDLLEAQSGFEALSLP
jgi:hypothetical protein